jgi:hypothetical protein
MTTAAQLTADLQALGVTLAADGDRLRFYPRDRVTGEMLARLRDAKPQLLAMLQPQAMPDADPVTAAPSVPDLQPRRVFPETWPAAVPSGILADPVTNCSDCRRRVVGGQPGRPSGLCFRCWSKRR